MNRWDRGKRGGGKRQRMVSRKEEIKMKEVEEEEAREENELCLRC